MINGQVRSCTRVLKSSVTGKWSDLVTRRGFEWVWVLSTFDNTTKQRTYLHSHGRWAKGLRGAEWDGDMTVAHDKLTEMAR